jgi:hypothetical protein
MERLSSARFITLDWHNWPSGSGGPRPAMAVMPLREFAFENGCKVSIVF